MLNLNLALALAVTLGVGESSLSADLASRPTQSPTRTGTPAGPVASEPRGEGGGGCAGRFRRRGTASQGIVAAWWTSCATGNRHAATARSSMWPCVRGTARSKSPARTRSGSGPKAASGT